jgi:CRISPR/Cas system Type II protein with McrA/HNH and RuvC-like nuclease domain
MDKVLVLNADYSPINVTSVYRGFNLVNKGKAEILKSSDNPIKAGITEYVRPLIIRLLNYVKYRSQKLRINRPRIYRRDNYECVYCGSKKNLTIDHILPKSKGGQNTWINLITCCSPCNRFKGDRTPEEANMSMRYKPYEPSIFSEIINPTVEVIWNDFKKSSMS